MSVFQLFLQLEKLINDHLYAADCCNNHYQYMLHIKMEHYTYGRVPRKAKQTIENIDCCCQVHLSWSKLLTVMR